MTWILLGLILSVAANAQPAPVTPTFQGLNVPGIGTFGTIKLPGSIAHGLLLGEAGLGVQSVSPGTPGQIPISQGAGDDPVFSSVSGDCTLSSNGVMSCSGSGAYTSVLGSQSATPQARADWQVNLKDYGVKCDGSTNDGPAFNAAMVAVKANYSVTTGLPSANLIWPPGTCRINTTLDLTGLTGAPQVVVTAYGVTFEAHTTGMPVVDLTGSSRVRWQGGRIVGDATDIPVVGMRVGRGAVAPAQGSFNKIDSLSIEGSFSVGAFYNNQGEQTIVTNAIFNDNYPTAGQLVSNPSAVGGHGLINDGYSLFWSAVPTVLAGATSPGMGSFVGASYKDIYVSATGTNAAALGSAIWAGNTYGHVYSGANYATTGGAGGPTVELYAAAGGTNFALDLGHLHSELHGSTSSPIVLFDGTSTATTYQAFSLSEESCCGTPPGASSFFGLGGSLTSLVMTGARFSFANPNNMTGIFDDPTKYMFSGYAYLGGNVSYWNLVTCANRDSGQGMIGGSLDLTGNVTTCATTLALPKGSTAFLGIGTIAPTVTGDKISINVNDNGRVGGSIRNANGGDSATAQLDFGTTSNTAGTITLNGTANANGNGASAFSINGDAGLYLQGNNVNGVVVNTSGNVLLPGVATAGTIAGVLCATSAKLVLYEGGVSSCTISLGRLKQDIHAIAGEKALADIMALRPVDFRMREGNTRLQSGFVAEDVESVDPKLATYDGHGGLQGYRENAILAELVRVVQAQQRDIAALKRR